MTYKTSNTQKLSSGEKLLMSHFLDLSIQEKKEEILGSHIFQRMASTHTKRQFKKLLNKLIGKRFLQITNTKYLRKWQNDETINTPNKLPMDTDDNSTVDDGD